MNKLIRKKIVQNNARFIGQYILQENLMLKNYINYLKSIYYII